MAMYSPVGAGFPQNGMQAMMIESGPNGVGANGLPFMDEDEKDSARGKMIGAVIGLLTVPRVLGFLVAWAIAHFGSSLQYTVRIRALGDDMGYLYIGAYVFSFMVSFLNKYPMVYKGQVIKNGSGNLSSNMQIFKVLAAPGSQPLPYVVLEDEGTVGEYNRANRSLHHFNENVASVIVNIVLAGRVFAFPVFILVCIFSFGRLLHQIMYAEGGYGKHGLGFAVSQLVDTILEGLVLFIAIVSFSGWAF
mmetsp:Transcript_39104/g.102519  ORF Transcript_39104/g.102519 Transcript_39104/m.102519 type:complete len:248 (-) Transcript_39104:175-918(-)